MRASVSAAERGRAWARFLPELLLRYVPMALLVAFWFSAIVPDASRTVSGWLLAATGVAFFARNVAKYPLRFRPVEHLADLAARIDAGPLRGIPVQISGTVMGRGMPGYVLSPDLVLRDGSGFVAMIYRQPIPFAREWFGLVKVESYIGQDAVARGWYRRAPQPMLELHSVVTADGRRARPYWWATAFLLSAAAVLIGLLLVAGG